VTEYVSAALRRLVQSRAESRCEYCLIHEDDALLPHEPDHIIAVEHRGRTEESTLAGRALSAIEPKGVTCRQLTSKRSSSFVYSTHEPTTGSVIFNSKPMGRSPR